MIDIQQGDVYLYQTDDDGEINVNNGVVEMRGGLETSAYLSLFGGNEDDDGSENNPETWWGNLDDNEVSKKYVSRLQNLIQSLPLISGNLGRIEQAATQDLNWMLDETAATGLEVTATIPALNTVEVTINIDYIDEKLEFKFLANWEKDSGVTV